MSRPSTRLSSREPTRKRRRAPPPLSVTNVFADTRLPDSSETLWKWPVTSWYLGDVGNADLRLATDRPFVKTGTSLPPAGKHYRLRWLEEDATKLVDGVEPQLPEPLSVLPYARQRDATACGRPSRGLGTSSERNTPGRPRKRRCVPKEAPIVEPAMIGLADKDALMKDAFDAKPAPAQSLLPASAASAVAPVAQTVVPNSFVAKCEPLSINVKPQNPMERESKISPVSNFCTPPLSLPPPEIPSSSETTPCVTPTENKSPASPYEQLLTPQKEDAKESIHDEIKDDEDDSEHDSRKEVLLQFVSPDEPRLMGTLTYSLPVNAAPEKEAKEILVDDPPPGVKQTSFDQDDTYVEDLDLEFRNSARPFEDAFDDADITSDELRPEILRLHHILGDIISKTKTFRAAITTVAKGEIERQTRFDEMESEEKHIIARLKEIEKEKAAAKAAEKAALVKAKAEARRLADRLDTQGRRRRPSRKIQPDSDEEDENEEHSDLKITSEPVLVQTPSEPDAVDEPKSPIKPEPNTNLSCEPEDAATPILNVTDDARAVDNTATAEAPMEPTPAPFSVPENEECDKHEVIQEHVKSAATGKSDVPSEHDSVAMQIEANNDSVTAATSEADKRTSKLVESVVHDAPACDVVSPECVTQLNLGLEQVGKEVPSTVLPPLKLDGPSVQASDSDSSRKKNRTSFTELTNAEFKPSYKATDKLNSASLLVVDDSGLEKSAASDGARNICESLQTELTPAEPDVETTTTPITEIDMDVAPESDDEFKPKEAPPNDGTERKEHRPNSTEKQVQLDCSSQSVPQPKEETPYIIFLKDGMDTEQLIRMPSPVSPLQAATPTCGFVVFPTGEPPKVLTSGSALVNHMKAMQAEAQKRSSEQNSS